MKKRIVSMVLTALLLLSLLTACGESSSEGTAAPPVPTDVVSSETTPSPVPSTVPTPSEEPAPSTLPSQSVEPVEPEEPIEPEKPSSEPVESAQPEPEPVESEEPSPEPEPSAEPAEPEETTPKPEPEPEETIDPSSKLLPNISTFLYHDRSYKTDGGHGREISCNGSHPGSSFEPVMEELLALLDEDKYQLEMVDSWINPHYSGIEMHDFFYRYTGTAEGMETLVDKYEEHEFHVMLRMTYYPEYDYFKLSITYNDQFDVIDPGSRTLWDIEHDGAGGPLTAPPGGSSGSGSDFWEKCSSCHGSGKCTHCNGRGEVQKFQAGLGWVDQDCTLCNRGKCRHCNGTGKD